MAKIIKRKVSWSWRDYERQHGARAQRAPAAAEPAPREPAADAYWRDGTMMIEIAPHSAVAEPAAIRLGLVRAERVAA